MGSTAALPRRPTLVLAPFSPGFGNASSPKNVVKLTNPVNENVNMNQAFRGINIEVGPGNPGAIGLFAQGAQVTNYPCPPYFAAACRLVIARLRPAPPCRDSQRCAVAAGCAASQGMSVQDVSVNMSSPSGGFAGFAGGNGAGGSHVNIAVTGGRYGVHFAHADGAALVLSARLVGQSVSAVFFGGTDPGWSSSIRTMALVGLDVVQPTSPSPSGPAIDAGVGRAITVLDSVVDCGGGGGTAVRGMGGVYLRDLFATRCPTVLTQPGTRHPDIPARATGSAAPAGWTRATEVARGTNCWNRNATVVMDVVYVDGIRHPNGSVVNATGAAPPPGLVAARAPWAEDEFPSARTATDAVASCDARGDGGYDDTAALQRCLDEHDTVLLPKGLYRISATLTMRPGTALIGISQTHSVIAPASAGFANVAGSAEG